MDVPIRHDGIYVFADFRLDPVSRTLTRQGARIPLPARLFDTLLCLVSNHDRLVERDELLQTVWPGRTVDQGSLGRAISSLREVLKSHGAAETLIVTAPGRGYRFGTRVVFEPVEPPPPADAASYPSAPLQDSVPTLSPRARRRGTYRPALLAGAVALVLGIIAFRYNRDGEEPPFRPPPHTVAVLPFTDLGGGPKEAYFADGLSEELINTLGRVAALHVAARTSSFSFRGSQAGIAGIARQLNVGAVLEGSIQRDGGRVRVTLDLIDATTGYQIWARAYDRDRGDLLSLQGEIAAAVMAPLKVALLGGDAAKLTLGGTSEPRAFDAYLTGMANINQSDRAATLRAIDAFGLAIERDPDYALAYARRARALALIASDGLTTDPPAVAAMMDKALRDAGRAVALAPELGEAHVALGFVLRCNLSDLGRAAAEYARAVELAPGDATILMRYARIQVDFGHLPEAIDAAGHAAALDPLTPDTYRSLARVLAAAHRYEDAFLALDRARRLLPADPTADRIDRSFVDILKGDAADAAAICGGARDVHDFICLAWADHALGRPAEALAQLAKVRAAIGDNAAYLFAAFYAQWGQQTEALQWLQTAYRLRDPALTGMRVDPMLVSLRSTPVFREIEQKLGFPR